ncbi:MAG: hypothetical protein ACYDCL_12255 [Myxococcales bacterium]
MRPIHLVTALLTALLALAACGPSGVVNGSSSASGTGATSAGAGTSASGTTGARGPSGGSVGSSSSSGSGTTSGGTASGSSSGGATSGSSAGGGALRITTASLPDATVGSAYAQPLSAAGGSGTGYVFSQLSAMPNASLWLYVTPAGTVSGTPQAAEVETVVYQVTDSAGDTAQATFSLTAAASGALALVSPAALPAAVNGGFFAYQLLAQGGLPPYVWSSSATPQPCYLDWDGWLLCAPTSGQALSIPVTVTDADGSRVTQTETLAVGSALTLAGVDSTDGVIHLPPARAGSTYAAQLNAYGGTGSVYSYGMTGPAWLSLSSGGLLSGTPSMSGNVEATLQVNDSAGALATATALINVSSSGQVSRPSYNAAPSNGFFVLDGELYDPNGNPFRIRGLDRNHYDSTSWAGGASGAQSGANAVRFFQYAIGDQSGYYGATQFFPVADAQSVANGILPIITAANVANASTGTSGDQSTTDLATVVAWWVANESTWAPIMNEVAFNLANEWGPSASTVWEYGYQAVQGSISGASGTTITLNDSAATNPFAQTPFALIQGAGGITDQVVVLSNPGGAPGAWTVRSSVALSGYTGGGTLYGGAVGALRAAGYTAPLVIDAGGYGQDLADLVSYAAAIQASDPLQNCVFSFHAYGGTTNFEASIGGIVSSGSSTTVTLDSHLPYHPFDPAYPANGNNYTGQAAYDLSGVRGMTSINGLRTTNHNNIGGTPGAWTVTLSGSFSGTYVTGSGTIVADSYVGYLFSQLAALRAQNVAAGVLEFGPGNPTGDPTVTGVGPSPTNVSVQQIIAAAEAYQLPWAYWAWDDNSESGGATPFIGWFGATLHGPGVYARNAPADLTAAGMDVLLNPRSGLGALASPAPSLE